MFTPIKVAFASCLAAGFLSLAPALASNNQPAQPAKNGEGARIKVAGRDYVIRFLKTPAVGDVEASQKICLWKDGTAWVIDPLHPDLENKFECRWPIDSLAADRSLAVVRVPDKQDVLAVADVGKKTLVAEFPDPDKEFSPTGRWIFSRKRQHAYCLDGTATGGWHYLDLAQKRRVKLTIAGFQPFRGFHLWNGALLNGGKEVVLFISGGAKPDGARVMQFPLDEIEQRTVAVPDTGVSTILHVEKDHVLAFFEGWNYGILATRTWKVVKTFPWGGDIPGALPVPLRHVLGPKSRHAYLIDAERGLIIYDPRTGELLRTYFLSDAPQRAVTFSVDGRHAVTSTKEHHITVLDAATHEVVQQIAVGCSPSMAFLIEPRANEAVGTCLVVHFPARGEN